ncbi:MAG TPA: ABC transporter ATP-binding protein [Pirellulales bacterium]|nr:ABC transporter ATP-binding protein [Pirellulales bacterium]
MPAPWQATVAAQLQPGETLSAWLELDLDCELRYRATLLVLTDRRLLELSDPQAATAQPDADLARAWVVRQDLSLSSVERFSIGTLQLAEASGRLAHWRYTVARASAVAHLVHEFDVHLQRLRGESVDEKGAHQLLCPSCGTSYSDALDECPSCNAAIEDDDPPQYSALFRLWRFAKPRMGTILLGGILTFACTAAQLIPPYLTVPLVDDVLTPAQEGGANAVNWRLLYFCLAGLVGSELLAWILTWARNYVLAWASERVAADIRNETYSHLQRLSLEFFSTKRTGDLITRVSTDSDRICNFISLNVVDFISDLLMIAGTAVILLTMNPLLAVITLVPIPFVAWLSSWVRLRLKQSFRHGGVIWAEMTSILADTIPGIRVVKAFAQETREIDRFDGINHRVLSVNDRANRLWAFFGPSIDLFTGLGVVIIWAFGAWQIIQGNIKLGILTAFLAYTYKFYTKLRSISWMVNATQRTANSARRIFEVLDRTSTVPEPVKPIHPGRLIGAIELEDVSFKYGNRTVLSHINLAIKPGEMIGLVGQSGSGKSTLINLICRFYDVADGSIRADGGDLRSFPVEEYRQNIGIVLQEPFLFYGTIADNIAYGKPQATRREIIAAARAAGAHEFILNLPEGYDAVVGERGQSLSGGERQRISIARALLIDPRILILDEATSSVDTETERDIQQALDHLIQGRTTIAIAHRLSTLRKADRLVVMERGNIVQVGPHHELLQQPGVYARLHKAQVEMATAGAPVAAG